MKILDPGHVYELQELDSVNGCIGFDGLPPILVFVKREGPGYPGNVGHHPGTVIQDVLRACIDRLKYVREQAVVSGDLSSVVLDDDVIDDLRLALLRLEHRAASRHGREIAEDDNSYEIGGVPIELVPTCKGCGHIGCARTCGR